MNNHLLIRFWLALLCLTAGGWLMPVSSSHAAVNCTLASTPNINFGTVDGFNAGSSSTGTLTYKCSNTDNSPVYVTSCVSIGNGTGGLDGTNRVMKAGAAALDFQLYKNAAHTQIWGSVFGGVNSSPLGGQFSIPAHGNFTGSFPVYGVIPSGQSGITSGSYTSSFAGTSAMISGAIGANGNYPASCGTVSAGTFPFSVQATVVKSCTIAALPLDFGAPVDMSAAATDGTTTLTAKCTSGLAYQIGLDNGQHAVSGSRKMVLGTEKIGYDLYTNAARSNRWGNTLNVDTITRTGTGANQTSTVYGRAPAQAPPTPGAYTDTVTVSVYY